MKNVMTEEFVDLSVSDLYEIDGGLIYPPLPRFTTLVLVVFGAIGRMAKVIAGLCYK